jgi:radical SAM superfamily enzyme YgiQ (UPF0313 family)
MKAMEQLPRDMVFFTQITMEAAEDPEFLEAMRRANIRGALVGVEAVTPEGLKDIYKGFNLAGEELVDRLREFRKYGVHILGSFIFGLPSDRSSTFEATLDLAQRANIALAQFVLLQPFPGTVDFEKWQKEQATNGDVPTTDGVPITRHWLMDENKRPKIYIDHPTMTSDEIRSRTQSVWDRFYSYRSSWDRSNMLKSYKSRIAFVLISKLYRQMYANTGIATDSARIQRSANRAQMIGRVARRFFVSAPMPDLAMPKF